MATILETLRKKKQEEEAMSAQSPQGLQSWQQPATNNADKWIADMNKPQQSGIGGIVSDISSGVKAIPGLISGAINAAKATVPAPTVATPTAPIVDKEKIGISPEANQPLEVNRQNYESVVAKDPTKLTDSEKGMLRIIRSRVNEGKSLGEVFGETPPGTGSVPGITTPPAPFSQNDIDARKSQLAQSTNDLVLQKEKELQMNLENRKADLQALGQKQLEAAQSVLSSSGFGRSTVAAQKAMDIQGAINNTIAAEQARNAQELAIFKAQQQGADAKTIASMQEQLAQYTANVQKLQFDQASKIAELNADNKVKGQEALQNFLAGLGGELSNKLSTQGFDIETTKNENVGYLLTKDKKVVTDEKGNPIIYKQPEAAKEASKEAGVQFIEAKADSFGDIVQPAGYFNKNTGIFTPISWGGSKQKSEFPVNDFNATETDVAEFTQVYEGSPKNAHGLDLAGKKGSAIKVPVSGKVISVGENGPWGIQVKVQGNDGLVHQFSHLDNAIVEVGQNVKPGTMVGTMGNTGQVLKGDGTVPTDEERAAGRGTHLDYTIYKDGKPVGLNVVKSYVGLPVSTKKGTTEDAVSKGYTSSSDLKLYKKIINEGGNPPSLLKDKDVSPKDFTEAQAKDILFARRMKESNTILDQFESDISKIPSVQMRAIRAGIIPNELIPANIQQELQAERDFLNAVLRKESGAVISDVEFSNGTKQYFPMPGDTPEVIAQKRANRRNALESLVLTSGKKGQEVIGELPQVQTKTGNTYRLPPPPQGGGEFESKYGF